jgi:hypothetical protein
MDGSFSNSQSSLGGSFNKSTLRRKVKKEYQNKDNDALKSQSDHKPLKRRAKSGGRSGSDDNNNDSCASLSMEEFASDNNRSLSSLGGSLRKSFRNILKPNNNDSSGVGRRERERKQYDCDDDESFSDRLQDDDSNIDEHIDQDRLMVILCKELEITCDDD